MSPSQPCCLTPQITTIIHSLYVLLKNCKCKNKWTRVDILPPAFTPKGTSLCLPYLTQWSLETFPCQC